MSGPRSASPEGQTEQAHTLKYEFAFVSEGFYVNNHNTSRWRGLPNSLSTALYEESTPNVVDIFGGPNGKYYLRTSSTYYSDGIPDGVPQDDIDIFAFGPSGGWFTRLLSGRRIWSKVPTSLIDRINSVGPSKVNTVSLGADGSWAITYDNGKWWTHQVPTQLLTKLRSLKSARNIVLSPLKPYWWVEDGNGGYHYWLPTAWQDDANHVVRG